MPLGIVSDAQFELEINSHCDYHNTNTGLDYHDTNKPDQIPPRTSDNESATPVNAEVLDIPTVGRHSDVPDIPLSLKKVLAETHAIEGLSRAKELASAFGGLSQPTLSTLGSGRTSPGNHKSRSGNQIIEHLNNRKTKISNRALNKLNLALKAITEDKMEDLEVKDLSAIAKDMAIVSKQMEPSKIDEGVREPVQFHFYAPQVRTETHYDVVVAKDNY